MGKTLIDVVVSALVLVVAGMFAWFAYSSTHTQASGGYTLSARFHSAAGLAAGNDVKIAGIKVGAVVGMDIVPDVFDARVIVTIDPAIKLPKDSTARIASEGLLGGTYLAIEPGRDKAVIPPGGEITQTESPEDVLTVIGKKIFSNDTAP